MKKTILILLIIFINGTVYAQYGDYYDGRNSYTYDNMPAANSGGGAGNGGRSTANYISIAPSVYIPTGENAYITNYTSVGGGFDIKYQYNFHKIFGLAGKFRYNYGGGSVVENNATVDSSHHILDFQILAVLQYDSVAETNGFIPYIAAGMLISTVINNTQKEGTMYKEDSDGALYPVYSYSSKEQNIGANVGFTVAAGLNYAFKNNVTIGFGVDYSYVFPVHDYSGVRVFAEAGYRF